MKKISESVPNLEEIPANAVQVPRLSLDQKVLNAIDEDTLYRSIEHSSSIELNSILHRDSGFFISKCSDAKSAPLPVAAVAATEMNNDFVWYTPKNKLDGFEMKVNNPILVKKRNNLDPAETTKSTTRTTTRQLGNRFNRFSKSIQNLFNFSEKSTSGRVKSSRKSVSEVNLTKIKRGRGRVGDSTTVLGAPYCPSSWFTMTKNLKKNAAAASMESPKGPFRRAWRRYKSMSLFRRSPRNGNSKR